MEQEIKDIFVTENFDATTWSHSEEIIETSFPSESTNRIMDNKQTKNMKNKTESKMSNTMKSEREKLKKIPPNLKRKTEDPSTSEMVMGEHIKNMNNKTGRKESKTMNAESKKLKTVPEPDRSNSKEKVEHPPTSEMVMDSIKNLKKRNGATFDDIKKYMEEKYAINMKILKSHVNKFLQKSVDNGILERIDGANTDGKFKIKKPETIKKSSQNLSQNEKERKPSKKMVK